MACESARDPRAPIPVFAASSLTESFEALEASFESSHPEFDVQLSFAGSQVLRLQIEQGAPAAVFASADESHVRALEQAALVSTPVAFAANDLVVAVPADDAAISDFSELGHLGRIVIGDESVPIGRYTERLLLAASGSLGPEFVTQVRAKIVSRESNVRLVRAKVELGESDAAIVYRSDVRPSSALRIIEVPADIRVRAEYFAAPVLTAPHPEGAQIFIDYLRSTPGRKELEAHGFAPGAP